MRKIIITLMVLSMIFLVSCEQRVIGGDTDEYGCLIAAGYQYCPSTEKCQRMWEEFCDEFEDQFRYDLITNFEECANAGFPVMESYPMQCRAGENLFTEIIRDDDQKEAITQEICELYSGNWNDCSNKCEILNAGKDDVFCAMVCEELCECGGIEEYECPPDYLCMLPDEPGLENPIGYCE